MGRKKRICRISGCVRDPFLGGLCEEHHRQEQRRQQRRSEAVNALHSGTVDGVIPTDPTIAEQLDRIRVYWDRACYVLHSQRGTVTMPLDEADYATEWCIALAQEIVDAQHAVSSGRPIPSSLALTGQWVWERFHNLDAGLCSNGILRK